MMSRRRLVFALLASLLVLAGSFGGGTAAAAAQSVPGTPTSKVAGKECITRGVPLGAKDPHPIQCFATLSEADAALASMRTTATAEGTTADIEVGWFWVDANAGGARLRMYGPSCSATKNLAGTGWNNIISSAQFFCDGGGSLYDGYLGGDTNYYGYGYHIYIGDFMNDRTSSIRTYPY